MVWSRTSLPRTIRPVSHTLLELTLETEAENHAEFNDPPPIKYVSDLSGDASAIQLVTNREFRYMVLFLFALDTVHSIA